jgi:hypothetical protein
MTASTTPKISPEFFTSMQGKALEAFSVVAEMNHRVLQGLVGLSAATAKEGLRACADLQSATVDSVRTAQAQAAMTPEALEALRANPFAWYQKSLLTMVEATQKAFHFVEANAQVVTRSAERLQASADQTGREIQEALTTSVGRIKEIYARN